MPVSHTPTPTERDRQLLEQLGRVRISTNDPGELRIEDVAARLDELEKLAKDNADLQFHQRKVGDSHEGRPIYLATIGRGPKRVLLWSQMHGDEATHTAVVLDLLAALVKEPDSPFAAQLLNSFTLDIVPMLNPDGAALGTRHNAMGIDINRDARRLATPEGRLLRSLVHDLKPEFGFNLHNQRPAYTVGDTDKVATVAVLAPPLDAELTINEQMIKAQKLALEMYHTTERLLPGHATRYDADYMPTAFGEWVQTQGVVTVLLEAGGLPPGDGRRWDDPDHMVEVHFAVLGGALLAIADGSYEGHDVGPYETIPRNGGQDLYDLIVRHASVLMPHGEPVVMDLAISFANHSRLTQAAPAHSRIADVGDLAERPSKQTLEAKDYLLVPLAKSVAKKATDEMSHKKMLATLGVDSDMTWREYLTKQIAREPGIANPRGDQANFLLVRAQPDDVIITSKVEAIMIDGTVIDAKDTTLEKPQ